MSEPEPNKPALNQDLKREDLAKNVSSERLREQVSRTFQNTVTALFVFGVIFVALIVAVTLLIVLFVF